MRLAPVYIACMGLALLILRFCSKHWTDRDLLHDPQWLARALAIIGSSSQPLLIGPSWTLDIEMQFYLVAPLLLLAMTRARVSQAMVATAGVALFGLFAWKMGGLPKYLGFFLAGALIDRSRWRPSGRMAFFSFMAFAAVVWTVTLTAAWRPLVIFPSIEPSEAAHRLSVLLAFVTLPLAAYTLGRPSDAVDRHAGDLAYSVYLFHPCVFMIGNYLAGFGTPARTLMAQWIWLLVLPGSLAMYLVVDRPAEVLRKQFVEAMVRKGAAAQRYPIAEPVGT
jgi:peptidoglycan/LPS O-acetylase OafA/YrhL